MVGIKINYNSNLSYTPVPSLFILKLVRISERQYKRLHTSFMKHYVALLLEGVNSENPRKLLVDRGGSILIT